MTALLRSILADCAAVKLEEITPPKGKSLIDAHEMGTMSEDLRRMWGVLQLGHARLLSYEERHLGMIGDHKKGSELSAEHKALHTTIAAEEDRMRLIKDLFWASMRDEFPALRGKPEIAFDENWKVWWSDKAEEEAPGRGGPSIVVLGGGPFVDLLRGA